MRERCKMKAIFTITGLLEETVTVELMVLDQQGSVKMYKMPFCWYYREKHP